MAFLVLLAAFPGSELMDETQTVAAGKWAYRDVSIHGPSARITASYEVLDGSTNVRLALMLREEAEQATDDPPTSIVETMEGRSGQFTDSIRRRGDYAVVVDNQDGKQASTVRLRVWLDYGGPEEQRLTTRRQITVVALSCAVFAGIVGFSARRLMRAVRH